MTGQYLEPSNAQGADLMRRGFEGPVVMLNLLRFRAVADYAATPGLAPAQPISGAEAFDLYDAHTRPHLEASGGELFFMGEGGKFLIGPETEDRDRVMLVRQSSVGRFWGSRATKPTWKASGTGQQRWRTAGFYL